MYPEEVLSGFTSTIVSVWLVGGIIIAVLGIIGIYLSQVYNEAKGRPRSIVRKVYSFNKNDAHLSEPNNGNAKSLMFRAGETRIRPPESSAKGSWGSKHIH